MIHVGVDLHQRFCYMTALEARGKILQAGPVSNEKAGGPALRVFRFRSGTVGAPLLPSVQGRVRCCRYYGVCDGNLGQTGRAPYFYLRERYPKV
jgi:hypothetical protein